MKKGDNADKNMTSKESSGKNRSKGVAVEILVKINF